MDVLHSRASRVPGYADEADGQIDATDREAVRIHHACLCAPDTCPGARSNDAGDGPRHPMAGRSQ
jgi:hypothetical protein